MKPLAASNAHIKTPSDRKQGVERNVRSSSAIEGISVATFRAAASEASISKGSDGKTAHLKGRAKRK